MRWRAVSRFVVPVEPASRIACVGSDYSRAASWRSLSVRPLLSFRSKVSR